MAVVNQSSPLSPASRAQYAALAAMRWSMFRNGLRSSQGAIELGARSVAYIIYSVYHPGCDYFSIIQLIQCSFQLILRIHTAN